MDPTDVNVIDGIEGKERTNVSYPLFTHMARQE